MVEVAFQPLTMSCPKESRMTASGTRGDLRDTLSGVYVRLRGRLFTIDEGPLQSAAQRRRAHGRRILVGQKHSVAGVRPVHDGASREQVIRPRRASRRVAAREIRPLPSRGAQSILAARGPRL